MTAWSGQTPTEFDQFFAISLDMLCIAGTDGMLKRVNPAWQETLGWTPEELLARPYIEFVHPDDAAATVAAAVRAGEGERIFSFEHRLRCRDGSYRWLNWKAALNPEQALIFCAGRDVTEHKRVNAELRSRIGELRELNEELEAFTDSVSHDLRTPLRHITGFAAFLEHAAAPKLTDEERRWLSLAIDAARRMGRLIDDLLSFSRMGHAPLARQRVRLDDVVREACAEVIGGRPDPSAVRWTIGSLPEVGGDPGLLRLAFINLIGNAVKYSATSVEPHIEIGTRPEAEHGAVIFVRDNGVGFDMQYAHKLFGVFQRLHDAEDFDGTGIGLANVRRIVARHGGRVWAESVVGEGATFFVALPNAENEVAA